MKIIDNPRYQGGEQEAAIVVKLQLLLTSTWPSSPYKEKGGSTVLYVKYVLATKKFPG